MTFILSDGDMTEPSFCISEGKKWRGDIIKFQTSCILNLRCKLTDERLLLTKTALANNLSYVLHIFRMLQRKSKMLQCQI